MKVIQTVKEFDEMIETQPAIMVDFFAEWCGPCKMIAPILEEIAKEITGVEIVKVDVDFLPEVSQRFDVMSIPTLCTFKDGHLVEKVTGFHAKPQIEKMISKLS